MLGRILYAIVPAFHAFVIGFVVVDVIFLACR